MRSGTVLLVQLLGPIVRLQVQRSSLKVGAPAGKRYDPAPLVAVPTLELTAAGVVAAGPQGEIVDVHHRHHPASKNVRGINGVSVGFTSHYAAMRDRFGQRLVDGIAGENLLVQTDARVDGASLAHGLLIETRAGARVHLHGIRVAEPCLEFTRFALGYADGDRTDASVTEGLRFLRAGTRGFYASVAAAVDARVDGAAVRLRAGDRVFRL